jgi:hypothetical protein
MAPTQLEAALEYAHRGWPVFPCLWHGPRRKKPLIKNWPRLATIDPGQIRDWWTRWPSALIGTPTGIHFVVLDIDPRYGALQSMAELGVCDTPGNQNSDHPERRLSPVF